MTTAEARYAGIRQNESFRPGIHAAVQLETEFEGQLRFAPMIAYNQRGFVIKPLADSVSRVENRIHYADIAPLLRYELGARNSGSKFYLTAGPVMGLAFSGKETRTVNGLTESERMKFSLTGNYGFVDMSMYGGFGWKTKKWFAEASYLYGLGNINNSVRRDGRNIQNRSLGIHIGYYLH